jgi:H+ antiporter protein
MLEILANRTYRHLFFAQVVALVGTGLATVALGLLAFDLAGANAGAVLGTALAIKMVAYIGIAPIASAFAERVPRRALLIALDLVRAAVALLLPFVTQIWQIYVLIFVLQSASAAFTPTFQATIPDVLPKESEYTRALSLSRLAYDLESLGSPALAAALLTVVSFHSLFMGTVIGFIGSALLVWSATLPKSKMPPLRSIYERTTRGCRIYLSTPRLRGLLALNLAIASGSAMVIVNTVVLVQGQMKLSQNWTAIALTAFGAGSMLVALGLPKLLERLPDRRVMLGGAVLVTMGLLLGPLLTQRFETLAALWFLFGIGYSLVQTPSGRLVRRSAQEEDRPALFAAQFALSHACWLVTYPVAGWVGATYGFPVSFVVLTGIAIAATFLSAILWSSSDPAEVEHEHTDLPANHQHLQAGAATGAQKHSHEFFIDDHHRHWPSTTDGAK